MGNFTGWTFAAVNAIASEVANIPLRLHHVNGDDHAEVDDHELLTLREGVNDQMTGIELKYVTSLTALLRGAIAADPFPMSPRGHQLRAILERLELAQHDRSHSRHRAVIGAHVS